MNQTFAQRLRALQWTCLLILLTCAPFAHTKVVHEERSLYSRIILKQTGSTLCLQFSVRHEQRNQSCKDKRRPRAMVFSYTRMAMAGLLFVPQPENILVIGLGGGTLPTAFHELFPTASIDTVEIDAAVVSVAEKFFGFSASDRLRIHIADARVWTKRALRENLHYDIVVLDAFNGEYIPEHLMTMEYLQETAQLLAPGGVLLANTFAISDLYDHESATYAAVFGEFINFRVPESANRMIVVPGAEVDDLTLRKRANRLENHLRPYAVPIERYSRVLIKKRRHRPDWRIDAKILTDQYAPANLLQGR